MSKTSFDELVGPTLLNKQGAEVATSDVLKGKKFVMLYFSAHWCPPCRRYTPLLAGAYDAHKEYLNKLSKPKDEDGAEGDSQKIEEEMADAGEIEVIFVSLDSVKSDYEQYRSTMPWLSVPLKSAWKIKDELSKKYGVKYIPTLIVLDGESCEVLTKNGKSEYTQFFKGEYETSSWGCTIS